MVFVSDNHNNICHICAKELLNLNSNEALNYKISVFNEITPNFTYRIVSNKCPGGVAIFQKGDVYKRQVFNAKMQCLSLFTMTRCREI